MNYNERLFILFDILKNAGRIKNYVHLAEIIGTNKAGINDLKSGKKKVTVDNVKSMILSYPDINIYWLVTGEGEIFDENFTDKSNNIGSNKELIDKICELSAKNALLEDELKEYKKGK